MNALEVRKASTKDFEFLASLLFLADQDRLAGRDGWDREQFVDRCRTQTGEEVAGKVANSLTSVVEADGMPVGRLPVVRMLVLKIYPPLKLQILWAISNGSPSSPSNVNARLDMPGRGVLTDGGVSSVTPL